MQIALLRSSFPLLTFAATAACLAGTPARAQGPVMAPVVTTDPGAPQATPARAPAASEDFVNRKLRSAVEESASKLGELEPWQKKIFDEEAVPQFQRFIRDYRSSQTHSGTAVSNFSVDIDLDSLKNYLRFYAPKVLSRPEKETTVLMYLRSGENCEKCVAAGPGLRKLATARVQRRGFTPVWLTADDLGTESVPEGKGLDDRVAELATKRGAAASLVIQWAPAPIDDIDTAHADEKRYVIHSALQVRGWPVSVKAAAPGSVPGKLEGRMELLENDSFETSIARLLTDEFTDLGVQTARIETEKNVKALDPSDIEVALEISGMRDFAELSKLKAEVQAKFPADSVEERKISRTQVILVIAGQKSAETVKARLAGLQNVAIRSAASGVVQMEMR